MGEVLALVLRGRQGEPRSWQGAACAALLVGLAFLPGCSELALTKEAAPTVGAPDPTYTEVIANHLKTTFKDRSSYDTFEISGTRWVHAMKGWSWLTCVRFHDHGLQRTYALFIKDSAVIDSRYTVQTDACDTQTYAPFAAMGTAMPASIGVQSPLY